MIVQIYEVTTPAEARALGAMGVAHIGVLVGEGSFPREQTIEKAHEIFGAIPRDQRHPRCRFLTTWISLCENVRQAIRSARPAGVDSKTKTDKSDGSHTKDLQKVSAFVAAARRLDQGITTQSREKC